MRPIAPPYGIAPRFGIRYQSIVAMDPALRRYLFVEQPIGALVVNLVLNALIAWAVFRGLEVVPLWGETSIAGDTIATSFLLPFLSVLIATPLVRRDGRHGKPPAESLRGGIAPSRLPHGLVARALVLGLAGLVIAAPLAIAALSTAGVTAIAMPEFIAVKAGFAALLGALLAPTIARAAMTERLPIEE